MPNSRYLLNKQQYVATLVVFITMRLHSSLGMGNVGVDYGLNGDGLMSPEQTVALLRSKGIARVRMYDAKQEITQAFANSGMELMIGVPNELVPKIGQNLVEAINWVTKNVASFPESGISAVIVGNEWLLDPSHDPLILLPAMVNIHTALSSSSVLNLDLSGIKVSTAHAYNVLGVSFPPSSAAFEGGLLSVLNPLLEFLLQTDSFLMVNIFPYFAYVGDPNVSLDLALFKARQPVQDPHTKLMYSNLFDMQLDAVYAALDAAAGFNQMDKINRAADISRSRTQRYSARKRPRLLVGESGWPSGSGDSGTVPRHATAMHALLPSSSHQPEVQVVPTASSQPKGNLMASALASSSRDGHHDVSVPDTDVSPSKRDAGSSSDRAIDTCIGRVCTAASVENARTYNQNLIRHVLQSKGTPANPTTPIQAYIFALFDENLKPSGTEQHYGLFFPNGKPVYPITFH